MLPIAVRLAVSADAAVVVGAAMSGSLALGLWAQRRGVVEFDRVRDDLARIEEAHARGESASMVGLSSREGRSVARMVSSPRAGGHPARPRGGNLRIRALLDAAPAGLMITGGDGRILHINQAFREMLPVRDTPEGLRPIEAVSAVEIHELVQEVRERSAAGDPRWFVSGDRDLAVEAVPIDTFVMVIAQDITQFRQLERARTDFVANVSHELRTPIAAILGYTELLTGVDSTESEDLGEMVEAVHRNAVRLRDLFDALLELHRIESRHEELPLATVVLAEVLEKAVVSARSRARRKGQSFEVACPGDIEVTVNPDALSAIVANLSSNACKYTPEDGAIRVSAKVIGGEVAIDVSDTGIGIPKPERDRVFERFYRGEDARGSGARGIGIGLAIVKHLAMATGVQVTLDSEEGKGTTFSIRIPVARAAPRATPMWTATLGDDEG